jgi:mannose-6-phosphate isomerase-like protein (cupin superfamily)
MNELAKARSIAAGEPVRTRALAAFDRQMADWSFVMPPGERLVSDFGLGDFRTTGLIECWIANEIEAGYCGKFLFVFNGQTCPAHRHKTKHETFFIVRGSVAMACGGDERELRAGDVLPVPPGALHRFTGRGPALLLEVSMPCLVDDNYFENRDIPIGGNYAKTVE